ncbi:MAG: ExbD/TolR family protein [Candidatus Melainabacteria bacterium]|jgi:biopolymer transport protein ExbD
MAFSSGGGRQRQNFSEINITPLTDVFLVLLVIMFLIAPLLDNQAALKVDPPSAQSASTKETPPQKSILVEITKEGVIAVNSQTVADKAIPTEQIQEKVYTALMKEAKQLEGGKAPAEAGAAKEKPAVKLKADNAVDYGRVVAVLDAVNRAQLGKLSLVTMVPAGQQPSQ